MKNKSNLILSVVVILLSVQFSLQSQVPSYLKAYKDQYYKDARAAKDFTFKRLQFTAEHRPVTGWLSPSGRH